MFVANRIVQLIQIVSYHIVYWPFRIFYKLESQIHTDLHHLQPGNYLIVANHCSALDPHLILSALPYGIFINLLPIRFFTANSYMRHWWQRIFLQATGCFLASTTENEISGVLGGLILVSTGNNLFIFPEGKRQHTSKIHDLKPGVGRLVKHEDFTLLPVFIRRDKKSMVIWGRPFTVDSSAKKLDEKLITNLVFKKVLELSKL